jgi:hypothetical protein
MKAFIRIAATGLAVLASGWAEADAVRPAAKPGEEEKIVQDPLTLRALAGLEKKLGIHFDIP